MIPGLFLVTITALALHVQLIMAWPAQATFSGNFQSQNFALQMRCPPGILHHSFLTACLVNVTKLQEQGCLLDRQYIHIMENTEGGNEYITNCMINPSNLTCLQSPICPSCVAHGTQLVHIGFNFTYTLAHFGNLTNKCVALCPGQMLESDSMCQIRYSWPALATFSGNFQSENFALQMRCPPIIQGLNFSTECLVNVTKLQEQECLLDSEHIYIIEKTEGGDEYITNCLINPSNRTCLQSSLCPSCVAHDTQLVRIGFNFSPNQAKFGSLTNKCVAVCPNQMMLESDSMCRIRYYSRT